ncbi:hypothetical protein NK6_4704 [Bradyrhizobium diazoefficiens]|uniref:Uncharacterized protein n=1 Tax=Bradyrhizobium diazoefficiens TaxID=1355477 RepID=A0A0E3VUR5_9BRAD|nr:hypothetical protein NK6_4704 [Bradyrhizobium diazoefficiens]
MIYPTRINVFFACDGFATASLRLAVFAFSCQLLWLIDP